MIKDAKRSVYFILNLLFDEQTILYNSRGKRIKSAEIVMIMSGTVKP